MTKSIQGTWFEFQHHSKKEGIYWNNESKNFTEEKWREKVKEIAGTGMEYIVLLATALDFNCYYDTSIFPKADLTCKNPLEVLLSQAEESNLKVFISAGFYGDWMHPQINMVDKEVTKRGLQAMNEIAEQYGKYKSLHGWYFPDETCINGYFSEDFIRYVNTYSNEAHQLNPNYKTLIAPYGTRLVKADDKYIDQLERIDIDYVAYQDEIGVQKTKVEESAAFYEALKKVHDKAGRGALWADIELFEFEGDVYSSALLPAEFSRIKKQIEAVSPYVDKILAYQYQGMMNKPDSKAFAGHPSSAKLYTDYMNWLNK
ncbi:DUF4434 domain-containing protein [Paludicola sp. MB14-C6]|uniref:DUF4434 domain-containing protein n=1 Tax=Paludihabitans sp. MB14-C6 TaxID=3070656 RepID=UPI0027DAD549|nr:DUF4434 domain-containing protein [Paludicola sp. MB14-C6]WMJ23871.1 DUF4434 domain-containing protein [Paludicola sp. MB14-C6]